MSLVEDTYSKQGVFSDCIVEGYVGYVDDEGRWMPDKENPTTVVVTSDAAKNILNGAKIENTVVVDTDKILTNKEMLENYGYKELYKSVIGARGASCESESMPLVLEVGMKISGSSAICGGVTAIVTSLTRTTDAQLNKITTSITGTILSEGE